MNFSPSACNILKVKWSFSAVNEAKLIKKKYSFDENYDLLNSLENAVNWYELEKNIQDQEASPKQSKEFINLLVDRLKQMQEIPNISLSLGTEIRGALIDYFNEHDLSMGETLGNLEDEITRLMPTIKIIIAACNHVTEKLPESKPGRKSNSSLTKRFIPFLAKIYQDGTGNEPKCEWNRENEEITPDCDVHLFIIDILNILKKEAGMDFGEESSIVKYVKDFWRAYKSKNNLSVSF